MPVTPAKAGVSCRKRVVSIARDPSFRWGDDWFRWGDDLLAATAPAA